MQDHHGSMPEGARELMSKMMKDTFGEFPCDRRRPQGNSFRAFRSG